MNVFVNLNSYGVLISSYTSQSVEVPPGKAVKGKDFESFVGVGLLTPVPEAMVDVSAIVAVSKHVPNSMSPKPAEEAPAVNPEEGTVLVLTPEQLVESELAEAIAAVDSLKVKEEPKEEEPAKKASKKSKKSE